MARRRKSKGKRSTILSGIEPMLCTLVKEPFTDPDWIYEIKWDGYRLIGYVQKGKVRLTSRSGLDYTAKYPPLEKALRSIKHNMVIDGEAVVFNEQGKPDFDALQNFNGHYSPIAYCVFDLLWLDGYSLLDLPLMERKAMLQEMVKGQDLIRFSEQYDDGLALYEQMKALNLEGMVGKKRDSIYQPGVRGYDWVKVPTRKRQEFVIGGWAESDKQRSFRSLLFGAYNPKGQFEWIGRSGGGFKEKEMPAILKKLKALEIERSPFVNPVLDTKRAAIHYVKPSLVANFEFATWTKSGRIRKPATFLGFRKDKKAKQVVREQVVSAATVAEPEQVPTHSSKRKYLNADSNWRKVDQEQKDAQWQEMNMEHCTVQVHNVERELWKDVPKAQLLLYYHSISQYILPHIKDRPQSLNLKLSGAGSPTIYLKDMENRQPTCAQIFTDLRHDNSPVEKGKKRARIDYLVANNIETLLFMVDTGCVDINPWSSRIHSPQEPDFLWIDLDPTIPAKLSAAKRREAEETGFQKAIETALATREVLQQHKLTGFIKTSGKTGMHIYVPCRGFNNQQVTRAATFLAEKVNALLPDITTLQRSVAHRRDHVYIDPQQNYYTKTLAAPYSVRPYHSPLVSTPLDWKEVKPSLDRWQFTIDTVLKRVRKTGDVFKQVLSDAVASKNVPFIQKLLDKS
ncbi:MAG: DNA ligase D [Pseudobacter sp.]|uniref:DNA ligase D n=1 Tax=Pseudobacter sp. TaxID=2045420 RepID=UPI003F813A65